MSKLSLLSPGRIGDLTTNNRMIMAPMTRSRAGQKGVPSELAIEYYTQRASAGLILTEGVAPSAVGLGYARTRFAQEMRRGRGCFAVRSSRFGLI